MNKKGTQLIDAEKQMRSLRHYIKKHDYPDPEVINKPLTRLNSSPTGVDSGTSLDEIDALVDAVDKVNDRDDIYCDLFLSLRQKYGDLSRDHDSLKVKHQMISTSEKSLRDDLKIARAD